MLLPLFVYRCPKSVEACFPQAAVPCQPRFEFAERLRPQRVKPPLLIGPDRHEAGSQEDAQMAGNAGLMDPGALDNVTDLALTAAQRLNDAPARGIGESLKGIRLHRRVYAY